MARRDTVHKEWFIGNDEAHPNPRVAAHYADLRAKDHAEREVVKDRGRVEAKLEARHTGEERRALYAERDRLDSELRRIRKERRDLLDSEAAAVKARVAA